MFFVRSFVPAFLCTLQWDSRSLYYKPMYQAVDATNYLPRHGCGYVYAPLPLSEFMSKYTDSQLSMQENLAGYAVYCSWFYRTQSLVQEETKEEAGREIDLTMDDEKHQYDCVHYIPALDHPLYEFFPPSVVEAIKKYVLNLHLFKLSLSMAGFYGLRPAAETVQVDQIHSI